MSDKHVEIEWTRIAHREESLKLLDIVRDLSRKEPTHGVDLSLLLIKSLVHAALAISAPDKPYDGPKISSLPEPEAKGWRNRYMQ